MNTTIANLTLGSRFGHLYRPLIRNLLIIIVVTVALGGGALIYFDEKIVDSLSSRLIVKSNQVTTQTLKRPFKAATAVLQIALRQVAKIDIANPDNRDSLFLSLVPFVEAYGYLDSINLADDRGNEFVVIKQKDEILIRHASVDDPGNAVWQRRSDGQIIETWTRRYDTSPRDRPWYQAAQGVDPDQAVWTQPYKFLTTKEPGISVAARQAALDSQRQYFMAVNITLTDISHHTVTLRPTENGMTVIFGPDGLTIGLPPDERFADEEDLLSAVLTPIKSIGVPAVETAVATWEERGRPEGTFRFRGPGNQPWLVGFSLIVLDETAKVWEATLVPEADFLGALSRMRNLSLAGIGIASLLISAIVLGTSMRAIRRQMRAAVSEAERKLGQYHLREKIGSGGNGTVYRAKHALLRRPTAIKLMNPEFARSEAARDRFEHEVQITSSLSHPNTVAIYDYGQTPDGTLYYAMELLNGSTLEQLVRVSGPVPAGRVVHILEQIAGSLAEAHGRNLIHRDIKPSNAILCERGGMFDVIRVLDFGLVKEIAHTEGDLTHANVLIGTPLFMAPEIISQPGQASAQSDLYALGAVGYYLLSARNVFEGGSAVEICAKHLNDAPVPPSQRAGIEIAADVEQLVLKCLAKDPAKRPASARELRDALLACRDAGTWTQRQAQAWWQSNATAFIVGSDEQDDQPLTHTEMLVDFDHRALSATVSRIQP